MSAHSSFEDGSFSEEVGEIANELVNRLNLLLERHEERLLRKFRAGSWGREDQALRPSDDLDMQVLHTPSAQVKPLALSEPSREHPEGKKRALKVVRIEDECPQEPPEQKGSCVNGVQKHSLQSRGLSLEDEYPQEPSVEQKKAFFGGVQTFSITRSRSFGDECPLELPPEQKKPYFGGVQTFSLPSKSKCFESAELRVLWSDVTLEQTELINEFESLMKLDADPALSHTVSGRSADTTDSSNTRAWTVTRSFLESHCRIMHPAGRFRAFWNVTTFILICIDMLTMPLLVFEIGDTTPWEVFAWLCTFYWTIDIFMSFRTGYYFDCKVEMEQRLIAKQYARTWLPLDLLIVLYEWFSRFAASFAPASVARTLRAIRLVRLVKLLRIAKMKDLIKDFTERIKSNALALLAKIFVLTMLLCVGAHFATCVWYALGKSADDGWTSYDLYAVRDDVEHVDSAYWYVSSARWTISQLNGRTDMDERRNMRERVFTVIGGMFFAIVGQAIFVSLITKSMLELSDLYKKQRGRRKLVNEYLSMHPIPNAVERSVKTHAAEYKDIEVERRMEGLVLALLPKKLQVELLYEARKLPLSNHELFDTIMTEMVPVGCHLCAQTFKQVHAVREETIFVTDDRCTRMLLVESGTLTYDFAQADLKKKNRHISFSARVFTSSNLGGIGEKVKRDVTVGAKVSEAALWVAWENKGTLLTLSDCRMLEVDAAPLASSLQDYIEAFALAVVYAKHFVQVVNRRDVLSDMTSCDALAWASAFQRVVDEHGPVIDHESSDQISHTFSKSVRKSIHKSRASIRASVTAGIRASLISTRSRHAHGTASLGLRKATEGDDDDTDEGNEGVRDAQLEHDELSLPLPGRVSDRELD